MKKLPATTQWLRASVAHAYSAEALAKAAAVDRQARILRGMVLAQEGPFKSDGRGEFDKDGLAEIVRLANSMRTGLKSRFAHPTLSDDGLGKYLGRVRDAWLGTAINADGDKVAAVRGDLHFDATASKTPSGDLAKYVMDLAESDPDAISSSLVLSADQNYRIDKKGNPLKDDDDNELPPLWMPTKLHASDVVDTGDAVDGLLSAGIDADTLPDAVVRRGAELLDRMFSGCERDVIEARCQAWLRRYLELRFGGGVQSAVTARMERDDATGLYLPVEAKPRLENRLLRLDRMALETRELLGREEK